MINISVNRVAISDYQHRNSYLSDVIVVQLEFEEEPTLVEILPSHLPSLRCYIPLVCARLSVYGASHQLLHFEKHNIRHWCDSDLPFKIFPKVLSNKFPKKRIEVIFEVYNAV